MKLIRNYPTVIILPKEIELTYNIRGLSTKSDFNALFMSLSDDDLRIMLNFHKIAYANVVSPISDLYMNERAYKLNEYPISSSAFEGYVNVCTSIDRGSFIVMLLDNNSPRVGNDPTKYIVEEVVKLRGLDSILSNYMATSLFIKTRGT